MELYLHKYSAFLLQIKVFDNTVYQIQISHSYAQGDTEVRIIPLLYRKKKCQLEKHLVIMPQKYDWAVSEQYNVGLLIFVLLMTHLF